MRMEGSLGPSPSLSPAGYLGHKLPRSLGRARGTAHVRTGSPSTVCLGGGAGRSVSPMQQHTGSHEPRATTPCRRGPWAEREGRALVGFPRMGCSCQPCPVSRVTGIPWAGHRGVGTNIRNTECGARSRNHRGLVGTHLGEMLSLTQATDLTSRPLGDSSVWRKERRVGRRGFENCSRSRARALGSAGLASYGP